MSCGKAGDSLAGTQTAHINAQTSHAVNAALSSEQNRGNVFQILNERTRAAAASAPPRDYVLRNGKAVVYRCAECGHIFYPRTTKEGAPTRCPACKGRQYYDKTREFDKLLRAEVRADKARARANSEPVLSERELMNRAMQKLADEAADDKLVTPVPADGKKPPVVVPEEGYKGDTYPKRFQTDAGFANWLSASNGAAKEFFGTDAVEWDDFDNAETDGEEYMALHFSEPQDEAEVQAHVHYLAASALHFPKIKGEKGKLTLDTSNFRMVTEGGGAVRRGRLGRVFFFKVKWGESNSKNRRHRLRNDFVNGLREGTEPYTSNRVGPIGARAFQGFRGDVRMAFANASTLDAAVSNAFMDANKEIAIELGVSKREALIAALSELHKYIPRCAGCGRFMATQDPTCYNPACKLKNTTQGEAVQWPPAGYSFKNPLAKSRVKVRYLPEGEPIRPVTMLADTASTTSTLTLDGDDDQAAPVMVEALPPPPQVPPVAASPKPKVATASPAQATAVSNEPTPWQDDDPQGVKPYGTDTVTVGDVVEVPGKAEPQVIVAETPETVVVKPVAGPGLANSHPKRRTRKTAFVPTVETYEAAGRMLDVVPSPNVPYMALSVDKSGKTRRWKILEPGVDGIDEVVPMTLPNVPGVEFVSVRRKQLPGLTPENGDLQTYEIYNAVTGDIVARHPQLDSARSAAVSSIAMNGGAGAYLSKMRKAIASGNTSQRYSRLDYLCTNCGHKFYPRSAKEGEPVRCPACQAENINRDTLRALAKSDQPEDWLAAASNHNIPMDSARMLASKGDLTQDVREALLGNAGIPDDVRDALRRQDEDAERALLEAEIEALRERLAELNAEAAELGISLDV